MKKVLILNADWQPLQFACYKSAFNLLFRGKAEIVEFNGPSIWPDQIRSPSTTFNIPATIRLSSRVNKRWAPPRYKKSAVFTRDNWQCQYCEVHLTKSEATIDHIHPRSKGGPTSWTNCVAACGKCNRRKANKSLRESGLSLKIYPIPPSPHLLWRNGTNYTSGWHDDWGFFIKS